MFLVAQRLSVEEVFLQAVQEDPAQRQAFLDATCADSKVRTRVEALLKAHDNAGNFLDSPAVHEAPLPDSHDGNASSPSPTQACASAHETLDFLERCATPGRLGLLAHYEILD